MLAAPSVCLLSLCEMEDTTLPEGEVPPDTLDAAPPPADRGGELLIAACAAKDPPPYFVMRFVKDDLSLGVSR